MTLAHSQVKWFKGKEELKPSPKYNMEVTPRTAVLTVKNAEKEDESDYRAEIENNLGKDKADMKAEVVEKEGKSHEFIDQYCIDIQRVQC